jgi:hypothetical protein
MDDVGDLLSLRQPLGMASLEAVREAVNRHRRAA